MAMKDAIAIAQAMTRIASVNPYYEPSSKGEAAVCEWVRQWAAEHGFDVSTHEVFPGRSNVEFHFRNGADHPHLLFNGHIDTVGTQGMTIEPFGGEIKDGRLWGRGSGDMKGQDACMMVAALKLREQPDSWRGRVTVGLVVDEEYQFSGIKRLMKEIPKPDYAIVGEPTVMHVVRGSKGVLRFRLRAQGRACHSSEPAKGRSAIVAMAHAILLLQDYFDGELSKINRPQFGSSTGSIGVIDGGSGVNIVPENCSVQVDVRIVPGQDPHKTYQQIQEFLLPRAKRVEGVAFSFSDPTVIEPAFDTPADAPLVRKACEILGAREPQVVQYSCDASTIAGCGVSTIVAGPGHIDQAHTARESIAVAELQQAVEQYVNLARALLPNDAQKS